MYEDAWYNAFVPRAAAQQEKSKHVRRVSLLQQPNEDTPADIDAVEGIPELAEEDQESNGPPKASLARRAKSYSDFHDATRLQPAEGSGIQATHRNTTKPSVKTDLDFLSWYGDLEDELLDASHEDYKIYKDELGIAQSHLDMLLLDANATLGLLSSLSESFMAVEAQTTTFQRQCEGLLADQKRMNKLSNDIEENLKYYTYLEPTTRRLNAPGAGNFVRSKDFAEMLSNLDSCLDYMQAHPKHSESAVYRSRYRLLLTRALTLIRVHFTNAVREIAADVAKRIADKQLNDTTMSALLYAKFRTGAPELKRIGLEIQKRAVVPLGAEPGAEAEYQSLMNELYQSYSTTRGRLLLPIIDKRINEIAMAPSTSKDVVAFARSSISFVRSICFDEYNLWADWFEEDGGVYDFLEAIMEPLFDRLRPKTIKETKILKLCELCTLIQTRYAKDEEEDEDDDSEPTGVRRLNFTTLIQAGLQDAQTRLVFLTLATLRVEIENYKPKPEDLEFSLKPRHGSSQSGETEGKVALSGRKHSLNGPFPKTPQIVEDDEGEYGLSTEITLKDWYPTLRKAIWLLGKIYRLVNSSVFDDIAHQITHQTTLSLVRASQAIGAKKSQSDASLFLISHLLLLKQQIVAFDIEFVTPDVSLDFTSTFYELRSRGSLFNPISFVRGLAGGLVPRVVENMLDAKGELDGHLRASINDFTNATAALMTKPLGPRPPLGGVPRKPPAQPAKAALTAREAIEKEVGPLRAKIEQYIEDARTRETLVAAVQEAIVRAYEEFWEAYVATEMAGRAGGKFRGKGKGREDDVWDPDAFSDWAEDVFGVGKSALVGLGIQDTGRAERNGDAESTSESASMSRNGSV